MPLPKKTKRRESEATRRKRSALARARQGPDGKWESNKKKAEARRAKRTSLRIGLLLAKSKVRKAAEEEESLKKANELVEELKKITDEVQFAALMPRLKRLTVTATLLRRTLIPRVLRDVSPRFPASKVVVASILYHWRKIFQKEKLDKPSIATPPRAPAPEPKSEEKKRPVATPQNTKRTSVVTPKAKSPEAKKLRSPSVESTTSSSSSSSSRPTVVAEPAPAATLQPAATQVPRRPSKPLKQRRITAFFGSAAA